MRQVPTKRVIVGLKPITELSPMHDQHRNVVSEFRNQVSVAVSGIMLTTNLIAAGFLPSPNVIKWVLLGSAMGFSVGGAIARREQLTANAINNDYSDVSDQVRTNSFYERLTSAQPDYTPMLVEWIVTKMAEGYTPEQLLPMIHKDPSIATATWLRLSQLPNSPVPKL